MKKILAFLLSITVILTFSACGGNKVDNSESEQQTFISDNTEAVPNNVDLSSAEELKALPVTDEACFKAFDLEDGSGVRIEGLKEEYKNAVEYLVIPASIEGKTVKVIGNAAFANDEKITAVILSDSIETIEDNAFVNCTNLTSFVCGSNLNSIGKFAFNFASSLVNIFLNDGLENLGELCFSAIGSAVIEIPDSVTSTDIICLCNDDTQKITIVCSKNNPMYEAALEWGVELAEK